MERLTDQEDEFLRSQMAEAWSHYRHCETIRAQYLSFFFSGYLAVAGFTVTMLSPDEKSRVIADSTFVGVACFLFILFWVSACFYILIVRLNAVLGHYARIMEDTRRHFFSTNGMAATIWSYERIGLHKARLSIFSVGVSIPRLIAGLCLCVVFSETVVTAILVQRHYLAWQSNLLLGFSAITAGAMMYLLVKAHKYRKQLT